MAAKPRYLLRVTRYITPDLVGLTLVRRIGKGVDSGLLFGHVVPQAVTAIAQATGLPVEEVATPWPAAEITHPERTPITKQQGLFAEEASDG